MIELLVSETCDQVDETRRALELALKELRIMENIHLKVVKNYAQARKEEFEGSPEVRIDGKDIDPHNHRNFSHKACRTYFFNGKLYPFPPKDMIKQAITSMRR